MNINSGIHRFIALIVFISWAKNDYAQVPKDYKGKPFKDGYYTAGPQVIPGRIELAYYDLGGEGIAYHDKTSANEGSVLNHTAGHARPGISAYLVFFREKEGVDISYTKDWADFNHPNKVEPKVNQLYIGWEEDGEWANYTVDIKVPGKYKIITVYGNADNKSSLWLNNSHLVDLKLPASTGNWHYWDQATIANVNITKAGLNLLTLKYNSGANLAYLDFVLVEASGE